MRAVPAGILVMGAVMARDDFLCESGMHANSYHRAVSFLGAIAATYFITQFSKWLYRVPALGGFSELVRKKFDLYLLPPCD